MTNNNNFNTVFESLEAWMDRRNQKSHPVLIEHKGYLNPTEENAKPIPGQDKFPNNVIPYVLYQNEREIKEFVEILLRGETKSALEVGMGAYGATHKLWSLIFDKVTSIDNDIRAIQGYISSNSDAHPAKSTFLHADSSNPFISNLLDKEYDFIFIDGNHSYYYVLNDYFNLRRHARPGSIIGFHDILGEGVGRFIEELEQGKVEGTPKEVKKICHSIEQGIGYFYV